MWRRLLPLVALLALAIPLAACRSSDNLPRSTHVRTDATEADIEAINSLVGDVLMRLTMATASELLPPYLDATVSQDSLHSADSCLPGPVGLEMDEAVQVEPGFNERAIVRFYIYTVVGAEKERVDYEWDVLRQDDRTWLLAEPPTCPF